MFDSTLKSQNKVLSPTHSHLPPTNSVDHLDQSNSNQLPPALHKQMTTFSEHLAQLFSNGMRAFAYNMIPTSRQSSEELESNSATL